jgi:hypothetical protein
MLTADAAAAAPSPGALELRESAAAPGVADASIVAAPARPRAAASLLRETLADGGVFSGTTVRKMLQLLAGDAVATAAPPALRVIAELGSLSLSLNLRTGETLAHIAVFGVGTGVRSSTDGALVVHSQI